MNIAIVEDESAAAEALCRFLECYRAETERPMKVRVFDGALKLLYDYRADYDVLFLDIELPTMDGMTLAEEIRKVDPEVIIVFVTNMQQFAIRGYSVQALDFIVKPVDYFNVQTLMNKIYRMKAADSGKTINIKTDNGVRCMRYDEVYYIDIYNHRLNYHTADGIFKTWGNIGKVEKEVPDEFFRCNSGVIVNFAYVKAIEGEDVLIGKERIRISRARRKQFLESFAAYLGKRQ